MSDEKLNLNDAMKAAKEHIQASGRIIVRDIAVARAWKSITEPPEGGFKPGSFYLGGYYDDRKRWLNHVYEYANPNLWRIDGRMFATPDYWQDDLPAPSAAAAVPLEPPPGWQGGRMPLTAPQSSLAPYTIPAPSLYPPPAPPQGSPILPALSDARVPLPPLSAAALAALPGPPLHPLQWAPPRSLHTLAAFAKVGKHFLTPRESAEVFGELVLTMNGTDAYIAFTTADGYWEPRIADRAGLLGYVFHRKSVNE